MKSVLMSIQPKYCELIASGKKTVEVRKTKPKLEPPFKVYIYQCKQRKINGSTYSDGKVIGEFVCDDITKILNHGSSLSVDGVEECKTNVTARASCLDFVDMKNYLGKKNGFAWHISDLVIYDKPKDLDCFRKPIDCHRGKDRENCKGCWDCEIKRPPQSWCYVEEMG